MYYSFLKALKKYCYRNVRNQRKEPVCTFDEKSGSGEGYFPLLVNYASTMYDECLYEFVAEDKLAHVTHPIGCYYR